MAGVGWGCEAFEPHPLEKSPGDAKVPWFQRLKSILGLWE